MIHASIAIGFLAIMVLVLVFVGFIQLRQFRAMTLRISYLEGSTDMILQSQERINALLVAYMEND